MSGLPEAGISPLSSDEDFDSDESYTDSEDLICKVALPFFDLKFQLYHEIISLGERIKTLKSERPLQFKKRVCTAHLSSVIYQMNSNMY